MKKAFYLMPVVLLSSGLFSCNDDNNDSDEKKKGLPIESVDAISCIDLSDRTDWILQVSNNTYDYTADGKRIEAVAKKSPSCFGSSYVEGSNVSVGVGPAIRLMSPAYYPNKITRALGPTPPDIRDQSTPEKLLVADMLSCYYSGIVSKNLENVQLTHANALLEFDVDGIPADAQIIVGSYMEITPYVQNGIYRAIVLAEGGEYSAQIYVKTGNEIRSVSVLSGLTKSLPLPGGNSIMRNTRYSFTVRYDREKESLSIENLCRTRWSGEEKPVQMDYSGKKIVEFKMYTGSPEGPKEVSTTKLDPRKYWGDRMLHFPSKILFEDDETASLVPQEVDNDTFGYSFRKDSLFRYNPYAEIWHWSGNGDKYSLEYNIGYFKCSYYDEAMNLQQHYISQKNEQATASGLWGDAYSLEQLKLETDTIMWCNIRYQYTRAGNNWNY